MEPNPEREETPEREPTPAEQALATGLQLQARGRFRPAMASYASALRLDPSLIPAWKNLGAILRLMGRPRAAVACYRVALERAADDPGTLTNLGNALADLGEFDEAEAHLRRALELAPRVAPFYRNLGVLLKRRGQVEDALQQIDVACRLAPDDVDNHWERALALLTTGDFENGWPEFAWRWHRAGAQARRFPVPVWDGSPLEGKTLFVHFDTRLSDALKFLRFVPDEKTSGGRVVVECPPEFTDLVGATGLRTSTSGDAPPKFDCTAGLAELAALSVQSPEDLPGPLPYLRAPEGAGHAAIEHVRRMPAGFRVGIAWDDHRVAPVRHPDRRQLTEFLRLFDVPGVRLFSLQTGAARTDLERELGGDVLIPDLGRVMRDFADVAGCLAAMDLVITTDNLLANLAGALGRPTWVVIGGIPDFTWSARGDSNPWYPSLRGFRASCSGDLPRAFDRVVDSLHTLVGQGDSSARSDGALRW